MSSSHLRIPPSSSKNLLKTKSPYLQYVSSDSLVIWGVKVPAGPNLKEDVANLALVDKDFLPPVAELSSVFPSLPANHIHIVVKPPIFGEWLVFLSSHLLLILVVIPSHHLELNCYVLGDDREHIFSVNLPSTNTVAYRKVIKAEAFTGKHVDSNRLDLWKVQVPVGPNFIKEIEKLVLVDEDYLQPLPALSKVLPPLLPEHVHIIVNPPRPCASHLILVRHVYAKVLLSGETSSIGRDPF